MSSTQPSLAPRRLTWPLAVGVVALVACAAGGFFSPVSFFRAYLAAYLFYLGLGLGCFALVMVYHLTGGAWGFLVRRVLEAGTRTLPLLALLFVPVACGIGYLFPWARPEAVAASEGLRHKQVYLNAPFFWARAVVYFAAWLAVAYQLDSWSRRQDRTGEPGLTTRLGTLSGVGLALFGVSVHFATLDWVLSLEPAFRSTIFGPLCASGWLLSALALAVIVLNALLGKTPLDEFVSRDAFNDLGNLLFTFVIVWGYMVYFQYMLIWIADIPHEALWYLPRSRGGWPALVWALVVLHFAVPFFLLLLRDVKRNPAALARVAALLLVTHLAFGYYQVLPAFPNEGGLAGHWMDFVTPVGIGGLWLADFLWELGRAPLVAAHDPSREAALHLRRVDEEEAARLEEVGHG